MSPIVDNVLVEANPRLQLFLEQINFVEETGCEAKGVDQRSAAECGGSRTG